VIVSLLICFLGLANAEPRAQKQVPGSTIEKVMARVKGRAKDAPVNRKHLKQFTVSEEELNAYIATVIDSKEKKQVESANVHLPEKNKLVVICVAKINLGKALGRAFKSGDLGLEQNVRVEATWVSAKGKGFFKIQSVALDGFTLPASLTDNLIKRIAAKQKPPIDPTKFLPLPYGIDRIEILPGKIKIKA